MDVSRTIVILSDRGWNAAWSRRQQFAQMLAEAGHEVLYVQPQRTLGELGPKARRAYTGEAAAGPVAMEKRLHRLTPPPAFPLPQVTARWSRRAAGQAIRQTLGTLELGRPVVIATGALSRTLLDVIDPEAVLFDPVSEIGGNPDRRTWNRAAVVTVESEGVQSSIGSAHADVRVIPNGVWWANYRRVIDRKLSIPAELENPSGPVAVIRAPADEQIDAALLRHVLDQIPELVLLHLSEGGPGNRLPGVPTRRVIRVAGVSVSRIPEYLACAAVALLPLRTDPPWDGADPQFAYEAGAAGLPVVSTAIPSLRRLEDIVFVADSPNEFVEFVRSAISERLPVTADQRSEAMREHAWNGRVHALLKIIEEIAG